MKDKQLVSIGRERIDNNDINGIILKESSSLLLLQEVYDFMLDGLKVIRQSDISDITQFNTDLFQTECLKTLGLYDQIPFHTPYNIDSWKTFFEASSAYFTFFTVEDEQSDTFNLGKIDSLHDDRILMQTCDGTGNWHHALTEISFDDITSIQVGNRYAQVYQKVMMGE